jgi:hypothetical protein
MAQNLHLAAAEQLPQVLAVSEVGLDGVAPRWHDVPSAHDGGDPMTLLTEGCAYAGPDESGGAGNRNMAELGATIRCSG